MEPFFGEYFIQLLDPKCKWRVSAFYAIEGVSLSFKCGLASLQIDTIATALDARVAQACTEKTIFPFP